MISSHWVIKGEGLESYSANDREKEKAIHLITEKIRETSLKGRSQKRWLIT